VTLGASRVADRIDVSEAGVRRGQRNRREQQPGVLGANRYRPDARRPTVADEDRTRSRGKSRTLFASPIRGLPRRFPRTAMGCCQREILVFLQGSSPKRVGGIRGRTVSKPLRENGQRKFRPCENSGSNGPMSPCNRRTRTRTRTRLFWARSVERIVYEGAALPRRRSAAPMQARPRLHRASGVAGVRPAPPFFASFFSLTGVRVPYYANFSRPRSSRAVRLR
jgi:hypothetical protein